MKILHVLYAGLGGHGNVFFSMVAANKKHEFEYEALFYGIEEVREDFTEQCKKNNIAYAFVRKNRKIDLRYYQEIYRSMRKSDPDVIFLHGSAYILPARIAAARAKKKVKIIVRETQANHLKTKAQWLSLMTAMFLAGHIVCLTEEFKVQVQKKLGWLYRDKKVQVIANGIDLDIYQPKQKQDNGKIVIGMQSRVVRIKDHITLFKAFALLKNDKRYGLQNIQLSIAGDGDFLNELKDHTRRSGLEEVKFAGMLDEEQLVSFLQQLDLYVHASLGETMSTAIMQAMACKLPIVASDVNGINNMISNRVNGILVPVKDEEALAKAIYEVLADKQLRHDLAQNAFEYAQMHFSNLKMTESYKKIYFCG